jgi:hypothetical protein
MEAVILLVALNLTTKLNANTSRAHVEETEILAGVAAAD